MEAVRRLRLEKGWNQNELAFYADLAPSVISLVETGRREPNATTLRKLAQALGVEIPDLFERSDSPKAPRPSHSLDLILEGNLTPEELQGHVAALDVTDARALLDELTAEQDRLLPLLPQPKATWTAQDRENFHRFTWINRGLAVVLARLASEIEALA